MAEDQSASKPSKIASAGKLGGAGGIAILGYWAAKAYLPVHLGNLSPDESDAAREAICWVLGTGLASVLAFVEVVGGNLLRKVGLLAMLGFAVGCVSFNGLHYTQLAQAEIAATDFDAQRCDAHERAAADLMDRTGPNRALRIIVADQLARQADRHLRQAIHCRNLLNRGYQDYGGPWIKGARNTWEAGLKIVGAELPSEESQ